MDKDTIGSQITNPLMAKIQIPGQSFTLPSRAIFYDETIVDETVLRTGEVHVLPLTAIDEIYLKSPDKLYSGDGIVDVFKHRIPSIRDPRKLAANDVDFLLVALRKTTYGDTFEIDYTHECSDVPENELKKHRYTIDINQILKTTQPVDGSTVNNVFSITLPNDQRVAFKPLRYSHVIELAQIDDPNMSTEEIQIKLFEALINTIDNVDGIGDPVLILEWFKEINSSWVEMITKKIEDLSEWGLNLNYTFICKSCGEEITTQIPLNPLSFFSLR